MAETQGQVVGFLAGLRTAGLHGPRLEADLLAVEPAWQRRGIATALLLALRRAADAPVLRGVVALGNPASSTAFGRAGFSRSAAAYDLLLYRIRGHVPRPLPPWGGVIRPLRNRSEAELLTALSPEEVPSAAALWAARRDPRTMLLGAVAGGAVIGGTELLQVDTVLYSGLWLETLIAGQAWPAAQPALASAAVEAAKERGLDEVGCLVRQDRWALRAALQAEGFVPIGSYQLWEATPLSRETLLP